MFEAEVAMERRSSFLPMLLLVCLVAAIGGMVAYVVLQVKAKTPLSAEQASGIVTAALQGPGPASSISAADWSCPVSPKSPETRITGCLKKRAL